MKSAEMPANRAEDSGRVRSAPARAGECARVRRLRRALRHVRIPSCARYEAYMQELAADYQRLISLGNEGGA